MSPSRNRRTSPRNPIGQAVFYPSSNSNTGTATSRRPSKMAQPDESNTVQSYPSAHLSPAAKHSYNVEQGQQQVHDISTPPPPPRRLSDIPFEPYGCATEFPFPSQQLSPSRRLNHLFDGLTFATPQNGAPSDTYHRLLYSAGSEPDLNLVTPTALPLSELIDEAYIDEGQNHDNSPTRSPEGPTIAKGLQDNLPIQSALGLDQAPPHAFAFRRPPATSDGTTNAFTLGSPAGQSFSPPSRLPVRHPSWSALVSRRASLPLVNVHPHIGQHQPQAKTSLQPTLSPYVPPSPLGPAIPSTTPSPISNTASLFPSEGFSFPAQTVSSPEDIFSPQYTLHNAVQSPMTVLNQHPHLFTPPHSDSSLSLPHNALELHYSSVYPSTPHTATQTVLATPPPEQPESKIAAHYLRDRQLCPSFSHRYVIRDELGSGGFGFVCSAVQTGYKNVPGVETAVKFIFKDRVQDCDYAMLEGEPVESYVLSRCHHPNIIGFKALYEDEEFFYLVQELHGDPWASGHTLETNDAHQLAPPPLAMLKPLAMPSLPTPPALNAPLTPGSASAFSAVHANIDWSRLSPSPAGVEKRPNMGRRASYDLFECVEHQRFSEDQARRIFKQIVDAVSYLHKHGIYHRDLKDENIVIDRHLTVKIIDFGSAVIEDRTLPPVLYDHFRGTMSYAAAEVLNGRHYAAGPADIWSIGIILGIILTGESPFPNTSWAQVGRIKMKRAVPAGALDLLQRCLCTDPRKRETIEQIERHPWLRGMLAHRGSVC